MRISNINISLKNQASFKTLLSCGNGSEQPFGLHGKEKTKSRSDGFPIKYHTTLYI